MGVTSPRPLLRPPDGEVMVVGFGRNVYGRFSLIGAYNDKTGSKFGGMHAGDVSRGRSLYNK